MTVLIIDDDPAIRDLMRVVVRRGGHKAHVAGTTAQAEEVWRNHSEQIDVIVSDANLGPDTGIELCLRFKNQKPHVRVIMCSGMLFDYPEDNFEVLPKPFTPADLIAALESKGPPSRS